MPLVFVVQVPLYQLRRRGSGLARLHQDELPDCRRAGNNPTHSGATSGKNETRLLITVGVPECGRARVVALTVGTALEAPFSLLHVWKVARLVICRAVCEMGCSFVGIRGSEHCR